MVGDRVRIHAGADDERTGVIVEDFGEHAGYAVDIGVDHIVDAAGGGRLPPTTAISSSLTPLISVLRWGSDDHRRIWAYCSAPRQSECAAVPRGRRRLHLSAATAHLLSGRPVMLTVEVKEVAALLRFGVHGDFG